MNLFPKIRALVVTFAALACTVLTLGAGLVFGLQDEAAPYLAAECRGFDALVASEQGSLRCDAERAAQALPAAAGSAGLVGFGAVPTFAFPEA